MNGHDAARRILDANGLYDVPIEASHGVMSDHYDPTHKVVRLSQDVYHGYSMSAVGIAAHEVGHAIQDARGYAPLVVRNLAVPVANFGGSIASFVLSIGAFLLIAGAFKFAACAAARSAWVCRCGCVSIGEFACGVQCEFTGQGSVGSKRDCHWQRATLCFQGADGSRDDLCRWNL